MAETKRGKIRKRYVVLALLAAFFAYSYTWTNTPYGKLDWRAAFSLKVMTPEIAIDHGGMKIPMPINGLFAVSALLPTESVARTQDVKIPAGALQIPARVYWPEGYDKAKGALPVIVYYHGGGFVTGSIDLFDGLTRSLANTAQAIVVSVDYRLAPVDPWPAGPDDAYSAVQWASTKAASLGGDPARLLVGGDSAGGNLAAVVSLRARDAHGPAIAGQILYYPVTDLTDRSYPSNRKFQDGYGLSTGARIGFNKAYLGHLSQAQRAEPYVSPIYAPSLAGLPPVLLITAGFDPLTDSAAIYAEKLRAAGVAVEHVNYPDIIHGFMGVPPFTQRREALDVTGAWVRNRFGKPAGT